ncbi:hypothetical protein [Streptomyces sp. SD15]
MRRIRELGALMGALGVLGALGVSLALVLLGAPSAVAGGPTSVLVASPESAQITALYYSDVRYGELERLLGKPGSGIREEPPGLGVGSGRQLNVTWMAHDVSPWRVDRVYPDSPRSKEVWIHTATNMSNLNGYWHRAEQPAQVRALFKKLGVLGKPSGEGGGGVYPAPWQTTEDASAAPAPTSTSTSIERPRAATTTAAATAEDTGLWWAVAGLAGGLALGSCGTLLIRRAAARREAAGPPREPRHELIDM